MTQSIPTSAIAKTGLRKALQTLMFTSALAVISTPTAYAQANSSDAVAPEHRSHLLAQTPADKASLAQAHIVVSAHPLASDAGLAVLEQGGNAIDAMVTVQTVLGLVEPQSSGLGGGAFLLYYDAKTKTISTYDGRETAPLAADEHLFIDDEGQKMAFFEAVVGGRSVGTPGTVKLLSELHKAKGQLAWTELLKPATELASKGFEVTPRLAHALAKDQARLAQDGEAAAYFYPQGKALNAGSLLKNPAYADSLNLLAKHGGDYFYSPAFAQALVDKVQQHSNPGKLSLADFSRYQVKERPAVCSELQAAKQAYMVCGMGPPSSGAIAVNQIVKLLEYSDFENRPAESPEAWQHIAEASRLSFADRGLYVADTDFVALPNGLLDEEYLRLRAKLIPPKLAAKKVSAGQPDPQFRPEQAEGISPAQASTTHFVIVDKQGNVVSMTSTIENGFGSRLMVKGFLLNNELTDFSFQARQGSQLIANRVQPGKRPRSSMAPSIVFKADKPYLALGSPGGSRIVNYVANTLVRTLFWQQPLEQAINAPHIVNRFGPLDLEQGAASKLENAFVELGYQPNSRDLNSGLHGVIWRDDGLFGVADKRREGKVAGR